MDQPTIERLLRLMVMLVSNTSLNNYQLADRLGVNWRTVFRYLDTLFTAGIKCNKTNGISSIDLSSDFIKKMVDKIYFSEEEVFVMRNAIAGIDADNPIKQSLLEKMDTLYYQKPVAHNCVCEKSLLILNTLIAAIDGKKQVMLHDYVAIAGKGCSDMLVEPFKFTANYLQLWCYEPETNTNILLTLSGIDEVETLQCWLFENIHKAGLMDIFNFHSEHSNRVRIKLNRRATDLLLKEFPSAISDLTPLCDDC